MNQRKFTAIAGAIGLSGFGIALTIMNPNETTYEAFAAEKVAQYAEAKLCNQAPFGLERECTTWLKSNQIQIRQIIADKTQRLNFLLFSIYVTDLSVSPYLPAYKFRTVGVFQQFFIYKAEQI